MSNSLSLLVYCSFLFSCLTACQQNDTPLTILLTGDVILDRGVHDELRLHGDSLLGNSLSPFDRYDFWAINLEGTLTQEGTKQSDQFNFNAHPQRAQLLNKAGITHASIANNHSYDYGQLGYKNTIQTLENNNIVPLGKISEPSILRKGKYQCALLAASLTTHNDSLAISSANELKNSVRTFLQKENNTPLVVYLHWGLEMQTIPQAWQKDLATELIDLGVDAIVGHHPHVTQSMTFINNKPVFYSLGNFVADAYLPKTDLACALALEIKDSITAIQVIPIRLKGYFPKVLSFVKQLSDLKKHLHASDISLAYINEQWQAQPTQQLDFSDATEVWMIAQEESVSAIKRFSERSYLLKFYKDGLSTNVLNLHGKLSEYQIGDINNDGQTDILVGIAKKVKFDSVVKKRINIYTFRKGALKPLWLGTKFVNDIISFDIIQQENMNYLSTVEQINQDSTVNRIYQWDDFGFELIQ